MKPRSPPRGAGADAGYRPMHVFGARARGPWPPPQAPKTAPPLLPGTNLYQLQLAAQARKDRSRSVRSGVLPAPDRVLDVGLRESKAGRRACARESASPLPLFSEVFSSRLKSTPQIAFALHGRLWALVRMAPAPYSAALPRNVQNSIVACDAPVWSCTRMAPPAPASASLSSKSDVEIQAANGVLGLPLFQR